MADQSGAMTLARAQIVSLHLHGLTLTALVERGVLRPREAASLVREAATFLDAPYNDPEIQKTLSTALEQIAQQIEGHPAPRHRG